MKKIPFSLTAVTSVTVFNLPAACAGFFQESILTDHSGRRFLSVCLNSNSEFAVTVTTTTARWDVSGYKGEVEITRL
jgi:hypothetical protein